MAIKRSTSVKRRIFASVPMDKNLNDDRRLLKAAILAKVREAGYEPQEFYVSGLPVSEGFNWNVKNVGQVMQRCVGAVVFGFPRWTFSEGSSLTRLTSEYHHYEAAVALTLGLPVFLLKEEGIEERCIV